MYICCRTDEWGMNQSLQVTARLAMKKEGDAGFSELPLCARHTWNPLILPSAQRGKGSYFTSEETRAQVK